MKKLRLAICQINSVVGDIEGNLRKILSFTRKAAKENAEIIVFPELALTGYIPEDLLFYPSFIKKVKESIDKLREKVKKLHSCIRYSCERRGSLQQWISDCQRKSH